MCGFERVHGGTPVVIKAGASERTAKSGRTAGQQNGGMWAARWVERALKEAESGEWANRGRIVIQRTVLENVEMGNHYRCDEDAH